MTGIVAPDGRTWTPPRADWRYANIHPESQSCRDQGCMIHNPDEGWVGNREDWPYAPRPDGRIERMCPHSVGPPDPDAARWLTKTQAHLAPWVHGCDGCCREPSDINPQFDEEKS